MRNVYRYIKLTDQLLWTNIQGASGSLTTPNTTRTVSRKAWKSPVEKPSREYKLGIKECHGNISIQHSEGASRGSPADEQLQNQIVMTNRLHNEVFKGPQDRLITETVINISASWRYHITEVTSCSTYFFNFCHVQSIRNKEIYLYFLRSSKLILRR